MTIEVKKVKSKIKWGSEHMAMLGRKGGAAKKGSKHKSTLDREAILSIAKDIVASRTRKLIDTQTMLAIGTIKIFRIEYENIGKKKVAKKPELVTNDEDIANVLYYEYADGENPSNDNEYFFVTTKDPENQAIKDLLDRTFGKAAESKNITVEKGIGALLDEIEGDDEEE